MHILRFPFSSLELAAPLVEVLPEQPRAQTTPEENFVDLPTQILLTQEEMAIREETAKADGYTEGFAKGLEQGRGERAQIDEKIVEMLPQLGISIASVQNMYTEAANDFRQAILQLSNAIAFKLAGKALQEKPDEAILQMLDSLVPQLIEQPKLVITVHPDAADHLQEKIIRLSSDHSFTGELKIVSSAEVPVGDCKVEWEQGNAVLSQTKLRDKIKQLLEIN